MNRYNASEIPLTSVVFEALGAASVCWESMEDTGVFQDGAAKNIGDSLVQYLRPLLGADTKGDL
jgi:hypothetical protein